MLKREQTKEKLKIGIHSDLLNRILVQKSVPFLNDERAQGYQWTLR